MSNSFVNLVWFMPHLNFFAFLRKQPVELWFDIGTGIGTLPRLAYKRKIPMIGVDPFVRKGRGAMDILPMTGQEIMYTPKRWPIICRPCHNGFTIEVMERALSMGASGIYVGLERNAEQDLEHLLINVTKKVRRVGVSNESLWLIERKKV